MKLVLKILALPVLFVVKLICILGNLLTNVVSYVIGLLLLVIGGSAIYCIVKALWRPAPRAAAGADPQAFG